VTAEASQVAAVRDRNPVDERFWTTQYDPAPCEPGIEFEPVPKVRCDCHSSGRVNVRHRISTASAIPLSHRNNSCPEFYSTSSSSLVHGYAECRQTSQHADHGPTTARNETNFQLRQPRMPESRVRGVVGVRVFSAHACSLHAQYGEYRLVREGLMSAAIDNVQYCFRRVFESSTCCILSILARTLSPVPVPVLAAKFSVYFYSPTSGKHGLYIEDRGLI